MLITSLVNLYTDDHVQHVLQVRSGTDQRPRKIIVYLRVSSQAQKPDLENQRRALESFCAARGLTVDAWIAEIGGGLNFTRPKFLTLVDAIIAGEVAMLVIAHTDRLVRFGYDLLTHLCSTHHCTLLVR